MPEAKRSGKVTARAVAERAGVAISSVSRVLNDRQDVSDTLREQVMAAVEELGYEPDLLAQSLRSGSTRTTGFILRDISNPLFADIVKAAEIELRDAGYSMLLTNTGLPVALHQSASLDAHYIRLFLRRRVDGLILSLQSESDPQVIAALRDSPCPLVLLDRHIHGIQASAVLCDHFSGVTQAVKHMVEVGHRRIAFISGPLDIRASIERERGYKSALERAGLDIDPSLIRHGSYEARFGHQQTLELLDHPQPPTAILCGGIQIVEGCLEALRERKLRVGRDISLVSCDEIGWLKLLDPPVNVVSRDPERMGRAAAELLVRQIRGDRTARFEPVATTYMSRGSVEPPGGRS